MITSSEEREQSDRFFLFFTKFFDEIDKTLRVRKKTTAINVVGKF